MLVARSLHVAAPKPKFLKLGSAFYFSNHNSMQWVVFYSESKHMDAAD